MKAGMPRRFLTLRDKNGSHRRSKSADPNHRTRPLSAEAFFSMFKTEAAKQAAKEEEEKSKESGKMDDITKRLAELKINHVAPEHIRYALASKFASGNADKAIDLLRLQQQSFSGIIVPYNPNVHMLGAENRCNVTCYLDALLFAMFAKLEAFECMLKNDLTDESQRKLAALVRLWVNMLRSGKLIHIDMTEHLQDALADCGWKEARLLEQQDTSEAFAFITETLQLPLLTLQVDLFHQGKGDADDHKVVYERLLNLAVPPDPEGKGIKLEDCLEEYFNTKVDVFRDSLDEKHSERPSLVNRSTIRLVTDDDKGESSDHGDHGDHGGDADHVEHAPIQRRWTVQSSGESDPPFPFPGVRPTPRHRSTSIIQRFVLDDEGRPTDSDPASLLQRAKRTGSIVVKAVTIPAWQFFRLIPWNAASSTEPKNDVDVARHFNQRPVVGICLKRYMWTESGVPVRQNTFIDIPDSLRLPHFMIVDDKKVEESEGLSAEYKLVLQSVVCHRGDSLHSGHYISFARVAPKLLTDNRRHDFDPPPDYEEAQWVKFDDLHIESRVLYVDDIKQALKDEMPYLLFYQIVPMVDVTTASTDGSVTEPPSYNDSAITVGTVPPTSSFDADTVAVPMSTSGYFDSATTLPVSTGPSVRLSSELDRPVRLSFDEEPYRHFLTADNSRRGSLTFTDSAGVTPAITPDGAPSPLIPQNDETTAQRLSRAAARFTKSASRSRSRPASQAGDGRISSTMSRLGLVRSSKDPLREDPAATPVPPLDIVAVAEAPGQEGTPLADKKEAHAHQHLHRKDRAKSRKSGVYGSGLGGEKEKGTEKDKDKAKEKTEVPERECVVM